MVEEVQMYQKYIGKTKQNCWKTKRRARKPEEHEQTPATTTVGTTTVWPWQPPRAVVVTTVRPWWLLPGVVAVATVFCVLGPFVQRLGPRVFAFPWGILGLFASFLLILLAHTS